MTKPARPKVLPTESSIPLPSGNEPLTHQQELNHLSHAIDHLLCLDTASQQALTRAMHENRINAECLAQAMGALEYIADAQPGTMETAISVLDKIEARLAELEPEERAE